VPADAGVELRELEQMPLHGLDSRLPKNEVALPSAPLTDSIRGGAMPELEQTSTTLPLRAAVEARDLAAVVDSFATEAVVRSPITEALTFVGHEQIGAIFRVILDVFEDLRYTDELRTGDRALLIGSARVNDTHIEFADHMRLDEQGKICELTVFFRPMPAIVVAARALGEGLGRRKSNGRARLISLLVSPLILLTRVGDRIATWLVRPTL
jgi:SnoaL-like domain